MNDNVAVAGDVHPDLEDHPDEHASDTARSSRSSSASSS